MRQAQSLKGSISAIGERLAHLGEIEPFNTFARYYKEVRRDDIPGLAGELTYRLFLALFPFFIFLAALGGFTADLLNIDNPTQRIMDLLGESIPADVASVLREQIDSVLRSRNTGLLSVSIAAAIWTASSGVSTLMKGLNRIYRASETRAFWKRYALAVGIVLLAGTFLVAAFIVMVFGQVYGLRIAAELAIEGQAARLLTLARLPIVFVVVLLAVDFLYWVAPSGKRRFHIVSPGSFLFTIAWLGLNLVFGLFVAEFGTFNATYGALAGVVVVLLWFYLSGFLLLLGAEIDAVLIEKVDKHVAPAVDPRLDAEDAAAG